jgi:DNA processing protein
VLIVSGLAYGIDTCAHLIALEFGLPTVGVLAHGLDRIYPSVNSRLAGRMIKSGALVTEFLAGTNPDRENFPKRNRIIAGLADAVLVIEAGKKGGALITADIANSYNRDVFAIPGRTDDHFSEGCNHLIKTNQAALIQSGADILYIMNWEESEQKEKKTIQKQLFVELEPEEEIVINFLNQNGNTSIDIISLKSGISLGKLSSVLLNLEFKGLVKSLPGKMYGLN